MKVLVFGCFDLFHVGHIELLKKASDLGSVIVAIGDDARVRDLKGKGRPIYPAEDRLRIIQSCRYVSHAFVFSMLKEETAAETHFRVVREVSPDLVVSGTDTHLDTEFLSLLSGLNVEYKRLSSLPIHTSDLVRYTRSRGLITNNKYYLYQLPLDVSDPLPEYDDSSKELLILYPLFTRSGLITANPYLTGAIYSKQSLLRNTNAIAEKIPVKFYMQSEWYDEVADYLQKNGISREDCILFDMPRETTDERINTSISRTGIKLLPMLDSRMSEYKRVMIMDADIFVCKTDAGREPFNLLNIVCEVPENKIGVVFHNWSSYPSFPSHWLSAVKDSDESLWLEVVQSLLSANFKINKKSLITINTPAFIFSPQTWERDAKFQKFVREGISKLRSDEAILSLYFQNAKDIFVNLEDILKYGFGDVYIHHAIETGIQVYFHHIGNPTHMIWLEHIGV